MVQTFYWCFTQRAHDAAIRNIDACLETHCRYCIFQHEHGSDQDYMHIQGYVVFKTKKHLQSVKNHFAKYGMNDVHLEPRRGTHAQARDYASKSDTRIGAPTTYGSEEGIPQHGRGTAQELQDIVDRVRQGATDYDLATWNPQAYMMHSNRIHALRRALMQPNTGLRTVIWIFGKPGSGKTRYAYDSCPNVFNVPSVSATPWFDSYSGQPAILLDNLTNSTPWQALMCWMDRYPLQVPVKGAFLQATWSTVYVTSIRHPRLWAALYDQTTIDPLELKRRITRIYCPETQCDVSWDFAAASTSSALN